jgi:hypothetical protein
MRIRNAGSVVGVFGRSVVGCSPEHSVWETIVAETGPDSALGLVRATTPGSGDAPGVVARSAVDARFARAGRAAARSWAMTAATAASMREMSLCAPWPAGHPEHPPARSRCRCGGQSSTDRRGLLAAAAGAERAPVARWQLQLRLRRMVLTGFLVPGRCRRPCCTPKDQWRWSRGRADPRRPAARLRCGPAAP